MSQRYALQTSNLPKTTKVIAKVIRNAVQIETYLNKEWNMTYGLEVTA